MSLTRAKYRATPDTLQDLQWTDLRVDANGALIVTNAAGATTSSSKLEDAAHASGDMGTFILAVQNTGQAALTGSDLDYSPIAVDAGGRLQIASGMGAFSPSVAGSLVKQEDAGHASGDVGVMSLGVRNDAAATLSGTDLDYTPLATTLAGAQHVAMGVARATASDAVSNIGVLGRVVDIAGNPTYQGMLPYVFNGTTWDRLRSVGSAGALAVEQGPYLSSRKTADGQVKASAGFVHTVTIAPTTATPTAGLLTIYDSLTETGTILYSEWVFATTPGHSVTLDVPAGTGIYVGYDATLANVSVAVSYR